MNTILQELKDLIATHPVDGIPTRVKHQPTLYNAVINHTKNLPCNKLSEKIYCYVNNLNSVPTCPCGQSVSFVSLTLGYREFCGRYCSYAKKAATDRRVKVLKERGGIGLANPKSKEKAKQTNLEKYGVSNPFCIPSVLEYNKANNPMKDPEIVQSMRDRCQEEYSVDWHSKRTDIKTKTLNTMFAKYGVANSAQSHYSQETRSCLTDRDSMQKLFDSMSITEIASKLQICETTVLNHLKLLGIRQPNEIIPEKQIQDWFISQGITDINKTRKILSNQRELDLYSPSANIAIEYCGLYWHCQKFKNTNYHRSKFQECQKLGITLITIFEDEWLNKRSIIQSRLQHLLKKSSKSIGARSCSIQLIDKNLAINFFNQYHISGYAQAEQYIGAFDKNNNLVACMSFSRRKKFKQTSLDYEWEMVRFSTDGKNIPGIASKLFNKFVRKFNPKSVMSYADLRYGTGNYLKKLGFDRLNDSQPNYWYFSLTNPDFIRWHRMYFNKKTLIKKWPQLANQAGTEYDLAKTVGLERIWDCGHARWLWTQK